MTPPRSGPSSPSSPSGETPSPSTKIPPGHKTDGSGTPIPLPRTTRRRMGYRTPVQTPRGAKPGRPATTSATLHPLSAARDEYGTPIRKGRAA